MGSSGQGELTRDNSDGHAGKEIRSPKMVQNEYLIACRLTAILTKFINKYCQREKELVLDVGCGPKPYQPLFSKKSREYIGIDIKRSSLADVICSAEKMPFIDNYFSAILCSEVLEHVSEPDLVIEECTRVSKKGSFLFVAVPGTWPVHGAPNDYWRWTEFGLKRLFRDFGGVEVEPCGNSLVSVLQLLELYVPHSFSGHIVTYPLNVLGNFVERLDKLNSVVPPLATSYVVKARKN